MFAIVTGASGHLGGNLVRTLISRGWKVRALVHQDNRTLRNLEVEQVSGDILNRESLLKAFAGIDVVFHLAARISVVHWDHRLVETININGVNNVVVACQALGVKRLVHTSSFHAMKQEPLNAPLGESRALLDPGISLPYNNSKAAGERIVRRAIGEGLDAIIITPTGMLGPYDFKPSHFGGTLLLMAQGKLPAIVNAGLNWVDTRDVTDGMVRACEHANPGEKYILGGHWVTLKDIATQVSQVTGSDPPKAMLPLWFARQIAPFMMILDRIRGKRPLFTPISMKELESNSNISHAKASKELGYEPRALINTIADTMEWFQANGFLITSKSQ